MSRSDLIILIYFSSSLDPGAAVGPLLAGWLAGDSDWGTVFSMLMLADVLALVLLSRMVRHELKRYLKRRISNGSHL